MRYVGDAPVQLPHVTCVVQEVERSAASQLLAAFGASKKQLLPDRLDRAMETRKELERAVGEDRRVAAIRGRADRDVGDLAGADARALCSRWPGRGRGAPGARGDGP